MKKLKSRILAALCILSIMALNAPFGNAVCNQSGKVVWVTITYVSATSAYAYIYLAQKTTFPINYNYYYTNNPTLIQAALSAQAGHLIVGINGNAAACADTGTTRYGGVATNLYVYTLF